MLYQCAPVKPSKPSKPKINLKFVNIAKILILKVNLVNLVKRNFKCSNIIILHKPTKLANNQFKLTTFIGACIDSN